MLHQKSFPGHNILPLLIKMLSSIIGQTNGLYNFLPNFVQMEGRIQIKKNAFYFQFLVSFILSFPLLINLCILISTDRVLSFLCYAQNYYLEEGIRVTKGLSTRVMLGT